MDKILVIDDEKPTLDMFRLMLNAHGYTVLTAMNGREGLDVFERERTPLVITDIKMPGMDGIEVLKRIKEIDPDTEVIVITGHGDMDLAIKALNLDATDFINKPIQRRCLEQALQRARERIEFHCWGKDQALVTVKGDSVVIHLRGGLTSSSEPYLVSAFQEAFDLNKESVLLLFNQSASVNGAGISILTRMILDGRRQGRKIAIAGLSDNFMRVFKIVGISNLVEMFESEEAALAAL